jgi:hypothetical protein
MNTTTTTTPTTISDPTTIPVRKTSGRGLRNKRIIYFLVGLCMIFAIVCIILASLAGASFNTTSSAFPTFPNSGLDLLLSNYPSVYNPLTSPCIMLSADKTKCLYFSGTNLYAIDLQKYSSQIIWMAQVPDNSFCSSFQCFLRLSNQGELTVQYVDSNSQIVTVWSNNTVSPKIDTYFLIITNDGKIQVMNTLYQVLWSSV